MAGTTNPLDRLQDVIAPAPPADVDGLWLVVAALLPVLALALGVAAWRLARAPRWRPAALAELDAARASEPAVRLASCATLLRRIMRADGAAVDAVTDRSWLEALDARFRTDWFTTGEGRVFADGLYRAAPGVNVEQVSAQLRRLLRRARRA